MRKLMMFLVLLTISCGLNKQENVVSLNTKVSTCGGFKQSLLKARSDSSEFTILSDTSTYLKWERIIYRLVGDTLKILHERIPTICESQISETVTESSGVYVINQSITQSDALCACAYDVSYEIPGVVSDSITISFKGAFYGLKLREDPDTAVVDSVRFRQI